MVLSRTGMMASLRRTSSALSCCAVREREERRAREGMSLVEAEGRCGRELLRVRGELEEMTAASSWTMGNSLELLITSTGGNLRRFLLEGSGDSPEEDEVDEVVDSEELVDSVDESEEELEELDSWTDLDLILCNDALEGPGEEGEPAGNSPRRFDTLDSSSLLALLLFDLLEEFFFEFAIRLRLDDIIHSYN